MARGHATGRRGPRWRSDNMLNPLGNERMYGTGFRRHPDRLSDRIWTTSRMSAAPLRFVSHALAAAGSGVLSVSAPLFNLAIPKAGYSIRRDIAYGSEPRARLDLYIPDGLQAAAPVLLFFHGGSWQSGDKNIYRFFGQAFASVGTMVAVAN